MGLSPDRLTLTPSPMLRLSKENFATLYWMVLEDASVQDRVCKVPLPRRPSLDTQDGVGPLVLKARSPEFKLREFSDLKLAVWSAQSVPWELVAFTR